MTAPGFTRCFACTAVERRLDAFVPVSYCISYSPLHQDLLDYKLRAAPYVPYVTARLAAVLERFLLHNEACVAGRAGTRCFDLVTTVPSNVAARDKRHPLRRIVGELAAGTASRFVRALRRSDLELPPRTYNPRRFETTIDVSHRSVLLIDDMWTTGASAQSAAAALKRGGADVVAAVVIGRYINGDWHDAVHRLIEPVAPFDFSSCVVCAQAHAQAA